LKQGRAVRLLVRTPQNDPRVHWVTGDLATGVGVEEAMRGVHSVISAATSSPIAQSGKVKFSDLTGSPSAVDIDGTRRLLDAAHRADVHHFLHVSIVGLEASRLPYSRVKLAGEHLVRSSPVPWSVVRATPYFYLLGKVLAGFRRLPLWPLPTAPWNPVDTSDVASYLAECLDDNRRGMRPEIGGPQDLSLVDAARQYQRATGFRRLILPLWLPGFLVRNLGFAASNGRRGVKTWASWLDDFVAMLKREQSGIAQ
jgi:uncharacterized protein YbjT (DUF2867 family)